MKSSTALARTATTSATRKSKSKSPKSRRQRRPSLLSHNQDAADEERNDRSTSSSSSSPSLPFATALKLLDPNNFPVDDDQFLIHTTPKVDFLQSAVYIDSTREWLASCLVCAIIGATYVYGVVCTSRLGVLAEAIITIGSPVLGYVFYATRDETAVAAPARQRELIIIETVFNVMVVLAKFLLLYSSWFRDAKRGETSDVAFWLFFCLQTFGFTRSELRDRRLLSFIRSLTLFTSISVQAYLASHGDLRTNGESLLAAPTGALLVFGSDASRNVVAHYGYWLLGVLYIDYQVMLPHAAIQILHICSYLVSANSGEFWHRWVGSLGVKGGWITDPISSRLLTASHLFVVDAVLWFRAGFTVGETPIARMPKRVRAYYVMMRPFVDALSLGGCLVCVRHSMRLLWAFRAAHYRHGG